MLQLFNDGLSDLLGLLDLLFLDLLFRNPLLNPPKLVFAARPGREGTELADVELADVELDAPALSDSTTGEFLGSTDRLCLDSFLASCSCCHDAISPIIN